MVKRNKGVQALRADDFSLSNREFVFCSRLKQLVALKKKWPELAGNVVASNVEIIAISNDGVLVLGTESSVWMHEIKALSQHLLSGINSTLPSHNVKEIKVKIIEQRTVKQNFTEVESLPLSPEYSGTERERIEPVVSQVKDDRLRNVLKRIFIKSSRRNN